MRVAIDVGYGYCKAVGGGVSAGDSSGRRVIIPSTVGPARKARGLAVAFGDGRHRDGHDVTITVGGEDHAYMIGAAAGRRSWATEAAERSGYLPLALTAAALVGADGDTELLLGLPLAMWLRPEQRRALRGELRGVEARVAIDGRRERTITVSGVQVLPQGAGAFALALQTDPSLGERPVGLIDVGYRTTDYVAMRRVSGAVAPDESACGSIDLGAGRVFEAVRQALSDRSGVMLPEGAIEDAIANYGGRLAIRGQDYDAAALVDAEAAALATAVEEQMRRLWMDRLDLMGAVLLAGGGGDLLHRHLRHLHPRTRIVRDPIYANAAGYLAMAG